MAVVRMTAEQAAQLPDDTDWDRINAMTDEEIAAAVADDPDAAPILTGLHASAVRIRWVRKTTGLSQEDFAARFRIPLDTLRDWEEARAEPDAAGRAYLRVIEKDPEGVVRALEAA